MNKIKIYFNTIIFFIKFIFKLPFLAWIKSELINKIEKENKLIQAKIINSKANKEKQLSPILIQQSEQLSLTTPFSKEEIKDQIDYLINLEFTDEQIIKIVPLALKISCQVNCSPVYATGIFANLKRLGVIK